MGRPPQTVSAADKKQAAMDEGVRNQVEGKFVEAKRRFSLNLVMTKLAETSSTQISLTFLVMNLEEALRRFRLRSHIRRCFTVPLRQHRQATVSMSLTC